MRKQIKEVELYKTGIIDLEELLSLINQLPPKERETVCLEAETSYNYDDASPTIVITYKREETDDEYVERLKKIEQHNQDIKKRELAELEKLKKLYEIKE